MLSHDEILKLVSGRDGLTIRFAKSLEDFEQGWIAQTGFSKRRSVTSLEDLTFAIAALGHPLRIERYQLNDPFRDSASNRLVVVIQNHTPTVIGTVWQVAELLACLLIIESIAIGPSMDELTALIQPVVEGLLEKARPIVQQSGLAEAQKCIDNANMNVDFLSVNNVQWFQMFCRSRAKELLDREQPK